MTPFFYYSYLPIIWLMLWQYGIFTFLVEIEILNSPLKFKVSKSYFSLSNYMWTHMFQETCACACAWNYSSSLGGSQTLDRGRDFIKKNHWLVSWDHRFGAQRIYFRFACIPQILLKFDHAWIIMARIIILLRESYVQLVDIYRPRDPINFQWKSYWR